MLLQTLEQTVAAFESVEVTVYLGKGDHYLFECITDYSADVSSYTDYTDFCADIPLLNTINYSRRDNLRFSYKALDCANAGNYAA